MTAKQAIARSITQNEIVKLEGDPAELIELKEHCEDWVQNEDVFEFWGTTALGGTWRVHFSLAAPDVNQ